MKINIIADVISQTGYGIHARQLAKAFYDRGIDIRIESPLPPDFPRLQPDWLMESCMKPWDKERTSIFIGMPHFWEFELVKKPKKFIGYVVWEGDKVPKFWIPYLLDERVDQIWVPSHHVKDAIIHGLTGDNYLPNKIKVVPYGVDLNLFKQLPGVKRDNKFRFYAEGGWRLGKKDRKGLQFIIQAFNEEFEENENVELVVKVNPVYGGDINQQMAELNLKPKNNIKILSGLIQYEKLVELYNQADVFVNASMAEAFAMSPLQAMACGLPVITTNFGGMTDYINNDNGWLVGGSMVKVDWDMMYENVSWLYPDIADLRRTMRRVFTDREEVKTKAIKALSDAKDWTWKASAEKAIKELSTIAIKEA